MKNFKADVTPAILMFYFVAQFIKQQICSVAGRHLENRKIMISPKLLNSIKFGMLMHIGHMDFMDHNNFEL